MYLSHFNLKREPFHITPDPYFFYLSPSHKEAFASMIYGLKNKKGFIAVIGEVGLGKTTVLRAFLEQYGQKNRIKTIFVFNANVSFKGLLRIIYAEMGYSLPGKEGSSEKSELLFQYADEASEPSDEIFELVQHLHSLLIKEFQEKTNVILIIDEAQNMPVQTLENLRMLSNLETTTDKLLQIFLIGQPELEKTLNRKELRQLKQRIAIRAILKPLSHKESLDYIHHRLKKAGADDSRIFSARALKTISKLSQGTPRKINILCDNALITGFGYGKTTIGARIIKEVNEDLEGRSFHPKKRRFALKAALIIVALLLLSGVVLLQITPVKDKVVKFTDTVPILQKGLVLMKEWSQEGHDSNEETGMPAANAPSPLPSNASSFQNQTSPQEVTRSEQSLPVEASPVTNASTFDVDPLADKALNQKSQEHTALSEATSGPHGNQTVTQTTANPAQAEDDLNSTTHQENSLRAKVDHSSQKSVNTAPPEIDYDTMFIVSKLKKSLPVYSNLSKIRQRVLIEMAKQTSIKGLLTFRRMIAALEEGDYSEAAKEMVASQWGRAVEERAAELAVVMRTGRNDDLQEWLEGKDED